MPLQLSWYVENRVMLVVSEGENSDEDLFGLDQQIIDYLSQSSAPLVHMLWDTTDSKYIPPMKSITAVKWPKHPQYGWTIMIGLINPFQRFIAAVASTFFKTRQRNFNTMDEALDFLNEVDSTLPALRHVLNKAS